MLSLFWFWVFRLLYFSSALFIFSNFVAFLQARPQAGWPCRSGEVSSARWGVRLSFSSLLQLKQNYSNSGLEIKVWHQSLWNRSKVSGDKQQFKFPDLLVAAMILEESDCSRFPCTLTSFFPCSGNFPYNPDWFDADACNVVWQIYDTCYCSSRCLLWQCVHKYCTVHSNQQSM